MIFLRCYRLYFLTKMDLNFVNGITFNLKDLPRDTAEVIVRDGDNSPVAEEMWKRVVLPGKNFSLVYTYPRYDEINPTIPYETDGIPVTLEDLFTTIYNFYQEPIPPEDREIIRGNYDQDAEPLIKRIDVMNNRDTFFGMTEVSPNTYSLKLEH